MSELDALLNEIEQTVEHMNQLAAQVRSMFSTKEEPEETVTFPELRALCANKSRDGMTAQVRTLIQEFGARKLSEIEPSRYEELYRKVEALQ